MKLQPLRLGALALVIVGVCLLISTILPWAARNGYAGRVIQQNDRHNRDASALFYTDSERTWEILRRLR